MNHQNDHDRQSAASKGPGGEKLPGSNYGFPNHQDGIQSGNLTDSKEDEHVTRQSPLKGGQPAEEKVKRGANEEDTDTAQGNVSEGYGSSAKASIISGRPDTGQATGGNR